MKTWPKREAKRRKFPSLLRQFFWVYPCLTHFSDRTRPWLGSILGAFQSRQLCWPLAVWRLNHVKPAIIVLLPGWYHCKLITFFFLVQCSIKLYHIKSYQMNMFQKSHALIQLIPYYHPVSLSLHIYIYIIIYIYTCETKNMILTWHITMYYTYNIYIYMMYTWKTTNYPWYLQGHEPRHMPWRLHTFHVTEFQLTSLSHGKMMGW